MFRNFGKNSSWYLRIFTQQTVIARYIVVTDASTDPQIDKVYGKFNFITFDTVMYCDSKVVYQVAQQYSV